MERDDTRCDDDDDCDKERRRRRTFAEERKDDLIARNVSQREGKKSFWVHVF
jgi:hypothetical protein